MFTNWLTGTSGTNNNTNSTTNNNINSNITNNLMNNTIENRSSNANLITNPSSGHILMSTPPDVILEVGPAPSTVRFVAHSIVLGMHSGYLRSAIRLDEQILAERNATSTTAAAQDFILYLGNVTAEQFAPLLTYMYTGYLDLNVENIFGVLLATHVLHMPRALEICRSFLARAQTEGYLGARLSNNNLAITNQLVTTANVNNSSSNNNNKIIRPIASKAIIPNFGFLPNVATPAANLNHQQSTQHQQHTTTLPIMLANFKNLQRQNDFLQQTPQQPQMNTPIIMNNELTIEIQQNERAKSEEIDVDQESVKAASEKDEKIIKDIFKFNEKIMNSNNNDDNDDDDDDEEVFIDSSDVDNTDNDETEVIIEVKQKQKEKHNKHKTPKIESTPIKNHKKIENSIKSENAGASYSKAHNQQRNTKRRVGGAVKSRSNNNSSGLQIAKAPIPASQLDANEGSKVIIDVASCDGPVRFRRILNTAYGHKPEDFTTQLPTTERSQQSVSYSFHQQMARTIHHQQQQQQQQQRQQMQQQNAIVEESENSESSGCGGVGGGVGVNAGSKHSKNASSNNNSSNEIYICVYCKHTFKSQYCYQKHAKRHLNPLSLSSAERCEKTTIAASCNNSLSLFNNSASTAQQFNSNATGGGNISLPLLTTTTKQTANNLLRREVRPLDMNVQYYPCKTCGSKFPSYYFVHKHRKLCHADEELTAEKNASGNNKHENSHTNVEIDVGSSNNRVPPPPVPPAPLPPSTQDIDATKMNSTSTSNGNDVQQQVKHEN